MPDSVIRQHLSFHALDSIGFGRSCSWTVTLWISALGKLTHASVITRGSSVLDSIADIVTRAGYAVSAAEKGSHTDASFANDLELCLKELKKQGMGVDNPGMLVMDGAIVHLSKAVTKLLREYSMFALILDSHTSDWNQVADALPNAHLEKTYSANYTAAVSVAVAQAKSQNKSPESFAISRVVCLVNALNDLKKRQDVLLGGWARVGYPIGKIDIERLSKVETYMKGTPFRTETCPRVTGVFLKALFSMKNLSMPVGSPFDIPDSFAPPQLLALIEHYKPAESALGYFCYNLGRFKFDDNRSILLVKGMNGAMPPTANGRAARFAEVGLVADELLANENDDEVDTETRGGARLNTSNGRFLFGESAIAEIEASYKKVEEKKAEDRRRAEEREKAAQEDAPFQAVLRKVGLSSEYYTVTDLDSFYANNCQNGAPWLQWKGGDSRGHKRARCQDAIEKALARGEKVHWSEPERKKKKSEE